MADGGGGCTYPVGIVVVFGPPAIIDVLEHGLPVVPTHIYCAHRHIACK